MTTEVEQFISALAEKSEAVLTDAQYMQHPFCIGPHHLSLGITPGTQSELFKRAVVNDHDSVASTHTVSVWDGTSPSNVPPRRPWGPTDHEPLGVVNRFSTGPYRCAYDMHTDSLLAYDSQRKHSWVWYPDFDALPAWAIASPFRIPLSWFLNEHKMQMIHGAAVALDGRGILLTAPGGSGKSTTALMCALAGMDYLGDDYVVIDPQLRQIHMVYQTAKLFVPSLALLPQLEDAVINRDKLDRDKGILFLDNADVTMSTSAALTAIVVPQVDTASKTRLKSISPQDALLAVLPSTIVGLFGGTHVTPGLLLSLVNSVPCYQLTIGFDTEAIVPTLNSLVENHT